MIAAKKEEKQKKQIESVPQHLIYEVLDGFPVYYWGYKEVLKGNKTLEDIRGYTGLQSFLMNRIGDFWRTSLFPKYQILIGGGGLYLNQKNNFVLDLAIFPEKSFSYKNLTNNYIDSPPMVVLEIDTKADPDIYRHSNYLPSKTQRLLDFGVEQVVWVFTEPEKVMVATNECPWLTVNWSDEINVLGQAFTIEKIIEEAESQKSDF